MMDTNIALILLMLLFGVFQGLTVCNLTCGPLLILRLAGQARGANEGLKLSFLFSLPRILILTVLGALLGALGYSTSSLADLSSFPWLQAFVYTLIAIIMIATGMRFIGIIGRKSCSTKGPGIKDRLMMFLIQLGPRKGKGEQRSMMGMGALVSVICFVEASGASLAVASLLGLDASDLGTGVLIGTLTMLSYSIGLTIPLLILGSGASEMGKRFDKDDIRVVGGFLLVLIGVIIILAEIFLLLT